MKRSQSSSLAVHASKAFTLVSFRVEARMARGEKLRVVGDGPLGRWDNLQSIELYTTPEDYPIWYTKAPVVFGSHVPVRYKYCAFAGGKLRYYEPVESERVFTPQDRHILVEEKFGITSQSQITTLPGLPSIPEPPEEFNECKEKPDERVSEMQASPQSSPRVYPDTLFIVSNSLPIRIQRRISDLSNTDMQRVEWDISWNTESLLCEVEKTIREQMNVVWVGGVYVDIDDEEYKQDLVRELSAFNCVPVFYTSKMLHRHYRGYCKGFLWPLFHNAVFPVDPSRWATGGNYHKRCTEAFEEVNKLFADTVCSMLYSGDMVWIHDFYLMRVPFFIHQQHPNVSTALYMHTPFPTAEIFRTINTRVEILQGMLSASLIGFHMFEYARHFLACCKRILGLGYHSRKGGFLGVDYEGRNVMVTVSHVGIEPGIVAERLKDPTVQEKIENFREKYAGRLIISGIDEAQRLKGIVLKLLAFESLLEESPTWRGKVILVQKGLPDWSRQEDTELTIQEVETLVCRINTRFGYSVDWELLGEDTRELMAPEDWRSTGKLMADDRIALWSVSDVLMVCSAREGVNLWPLEYVFTRSDPGGVVILSEFAAVSRVLSSSALRINPYRHSQVVQALDQALVMSVEERNARRLADLEYITGNAGSIWGARVVSDLKLTRRVMDKFTYISDGDGLMPTTYDIGLDFMELNHQMLVEQYNGSKRKLMIFNLGGVLAPQESVMVTFKMEFRHAQQNLASFFVRKALTRLACDPDNSVFVISGRARGDIERLLGDIPRVGLVAENGAFCKWPDSPPSGYTVVGESQEGTETLDETLDETFNESIESKHKWTKMLAYMPCDWFETAIRILQIYTDRTNGSRIIMKETSVVWNFKDSEPEYGEIQAKVAHRHLEEVLSETPVIITRGHGYLSIGPQEISKGAVIRTIWDHQTQAPDFVLCVGDDETDEAMFSAFQDLVGRLTNVSQDPDAQIEAKQNESHVATSQKVSQLFCCTIGKKRSCARFYLNSAVELHMLLADLSSVSQSEVEEEEIADWDEVDEAGSISRMNISHLSNVDHSFSHNSSTPMGEV